MILMIDLHNMAHRAAHTHTDLWSKTSGQFTGLYYGVFSMIYKIAEEMKPDFLWLVSDPIEVQNKSIWRRQYLNTYKDRQSTRTPEQERMYQAIQTQLPELKQALLNLNLWWFEQAHLEADDIIGFLRHQHATHPTTVVSSDRDLFPLISPYFTIYYPGNPHRWLTHDNFYEMSAHFFSDNKSLPSEKHTKLTLAQWAEYRFLIGDKSDMIPGLPRCGEKTALKILQQYDGYNNFCVAIKRKIDAGEKVSKSDQALISEESQKQFALNAYLMRLTPPQSPVPFDMTNPLCRVGQANFQWIEQWMRYHDFSVAASGLLNKMRTSVLCRQLGDLYAPLPRY